jgi:hypothetical protein
MREVREGTRAGRCAVYMVGSPAVRLIEALALEIVVVVWRRAETAWGPGRASASGCGEAVLAMRDSRKTPYTRQELDTGMVLVAEGAKSQDGISPLVTRAQCPY